MSKSREIKNWETYTVRASIIKKILKFDFENIVEKFKDHWKLKGASKMLISVSSLLKLANDYKYYPVPNHILENSRNHGLEVMRLLKEIFDNRIEDVNNLLGNYNDKKTVRAIIDFLIENNFKVLAVEKMITNGSFIGFIDLIVVRRNPKKYNEYFIIEIKCRNSHEPTLQDKMQCSFYSKMLWTVPVYLLIIDKDNKISFTRIKNRCNESGDTALKWLLKAYSKFGIPQKLEPIYFGLEKKEKDK